MNTLSRFSLAAAATLLLSANACERADGPAATSGPSTQLEGTWLLSSEYGGWGHTATYTPSNAPERLSLTASEFKVERRDSLGAWQPIAESSYTITATAPDVDSAQLTVITLDLPNLSEGTNGGRYEQLWLDGDRLQRDRNAPAYDGTAYTYSRQVD